MSSVSIRSRERARRPARRRAVWRSHAPLPLTLDEAIRLAEARSAKLRAQAAVSDAAGEIVERAGELPDPKLRFGIENLPVSARCVAHRPGLHDDAPHRREQGLPNAGKRRARGARAQAESGVESAMLDASRRRCSGTWRLPGSSFATPRGARGARRARARDRARGGDGAGGGRGRPHGARRRDCRARRGRAGARPAARARALARAGARSRSRVRRRSRRVAPARRGPGHRARSRPPRTRSSRASTRTRR